MLTPRRLKSSGLAKLIVDKVAIGLIAYLGSNRLAACQVESR